MTFRAATQTTRLGRYRVVKRLAAGGMADVLLARTEGIEGFERHIVIKRIHAQLLDEPRYIKMFLDEARLAASLHHHNIVQVNDIGEEGGEYFFAMEYVHGEDARNVLIEANKRGEQIPLEHVITIVSGAAAGLHYAHEQKRDIVHRDVSPANILVGFDGSVKVADFGIAMASQRTEQTQSGVLKGKVAYMSPEQCNCERVDRRSDVFSLGIVLYELATVHPCFHGDNDFMTMSAIVAGKITPPSHLNARVTKALEAIIVKALAPRPEDRYQTADELRQALEQYAATAGLRNSSTGLADYMKQQFGTRALPWQESDDSDEDDELAIPHDTTPPPMLSPISKVIVDPPVLPEAPPVSRTRSREIKPTLPLRAIKAPTPIPGRSRAVPVLDDDEPEIVMQLAPIAQASDGRGQCEGRGHSSVEPEPEPEPASDSTSASDSASSASESTSSTARARRRWWLFGSILAVFVAGLLLVLVELTKHTPAPTPKANTVERKQHQRTPITRLPAARLEAAATVEPAGPEPEAARAEHAESEAARAEPDDTAASDRKPRPMPAKRKPKWDPDALFPQ